MVWLGWYDPDKKKPPLAKLNAAIERYVEKNGTQPQVCLTSVGDAGQLGDEAAGVLVQGVSWISRNTFYVGVDDRGIA